MMGSPNQIAVVVCPDGADPEQTVLGLSVGERLLLALSYSGVRKVCFVGDGTRPSSRRAEVVEVEASALDNDQTYLVMASDTVFDRSLLSSTAFPASIAMNAMRGAEIRLHLDNPEVITNAIGAGEAPTGQGFAIRIDSKKSAKAAARSLLLSLRKPIDGFISTHLNRYVSLFCTRFLVKTGLPPNFFTVIFLAIGLAGAVFATQAQHWWALVLAGLLFQTQSILDGCDGEMARLTYQFSRRGQWLDSIGDDLTNYSVCFGLALGQAWVRDEPIWIWLGGTVLALQMITSGVLYRRMLIMGTGDLLAIPDLVRKPSAGQSSAISDAISLILKRDSFIFILSLFVVLQLPLLAFILYGLGTIPMAIGVILNDYRIARKDRASEQTITT
tara:strand:+ start:106616 stop:107776 length:1161 start_codon:yes stop_codon:yes gene_type:complete